LASAAIAVCSSVRIVSVCPGKLKRFDIPRAGTAATALRTAAIQGDFRDPDSTGDRKTERRPENSMANSSGAAALARLLEGNRTDLQDGRWGARFCRRGKVTFKGTGAVQLSTETPEGQGGKPLPCWRKRRLKAPAPVTMRTSKPSNSDRRRPPGQAANHRKDRGHRHSPRPTGGSSETSRFFDREKIEQSGQVDGRRFSQTRFPPRPSNITENGFQTNQSATHRSVGADCRRAAR